jgi:hypothetical protein
MAIRTNFETDKQYLWHYKSRFHTDYGNTNLTGEALVFIYDWREYGKWHQGIHSKQIDLFHVWVGEYNMQDENINKFRLALHSHVYGAQMSFENMVMRKAYMDQFEYFVYMIRMLFTTVGELWEQLVIESGNLNKTWHNKL